MSEVAKLREEFERKVKELQDSCPHEEITDWYNVHWAIGHPSLYEQRTCKRCDKIIEKRPLKIVGEFKAWAEDITPSRLKHRRRIE